MGESTMNAEVDKKLRRIMEELDGSRPRSASEDSRFANNQTQVFDDGTNTFFWRAHSITVLVGMIVALVYVTLLEDVKLDTEFNTKRGVIACIIAFCLFGMTQAKDGPFKRPHPAVWRFFLCLSVIYELFLIFLLFQSVDDARRLMAFIDPSLGKLLPEQSYAEDCRFYDPSGHPDGPFHNFWEKWDVFVFAHVAGWYFKMLMIRDYWLCNIISIMFEVLEYTFEHQLPNFAECWWDHWLMDFLVCNGFGIWLGMKTLDFLNIKTYSWRGLYHIPSYKGKLKRMILQFTPYSWTRFEWRPTENMKRWLAVLGIITMWEIGELNTFYLKYVLWIPPPHFINWARLILLIPVGSVAIRETYQYIEDSTCTKFGQQSWVLAGILVTEMLISFKFQFDLVTKPFPFHVAVCWIVGLAILFLWTVWRFCIWSPTRWQRSSSQSESADTAGDVPDASGGAGGETVTRSVKSTKVTTTTVTKRKGLSRDFVGGGGDASSNGVDVADQSRSYGTRARLRASNGK